VEVVSLLTAVAAVVAFYAAMEAAALESAKLAVMFVRMGAEN